MAVVEQAEAEFAEIARDLVSCLGEYPQERRTYFDGEGFWRIRFLPAHHNNIFLAVQREFDQNIGGVTLRSTVTLTTSARSAEYLAGMSRFSLTPWLGVAVVRAANGRTVTRALEYGNSVSPVAVEIAGVQIPAEDLITENTHPDVVRNWSAVLPEIMAASSVEA